MPARQSLGLYIADPRTHRHEVITFVRVALGCSEIAQLWYLWKSGYQSAHHGDFEAMQKKAACWAPSVKSICKHHRSHRRPHLLYSYVEHLTCLWATFPGQLIVLLGGHVLLELPAMANVCQTSKYWLHTTASLCAVSVGFSTTATPVLQKSIAQVWNHG